MEEAKIVLVEHSTQPTTASQCPDLPIHDALKVIQIEAIAGSNILAFIINTEQTVTLYNTRRINNSRDRRLFLFTMKIAFLTTLLCAMMTSALVCQTLWTKHKSFIRSPSR